MQSITRVLDMVGEDGLFITSNKLTKMKQMFQMVNVICVLKRYKILRRRQQRFR